MTLVTERLQRADRRRGARTKPRAQSYLWKRAGEPLGLTAAETQYMRNNRTVRCNRLRRLGAARLARI
ncbi:MAG TPA: hypothetical protein VNV25_09285 [Gemmatimonadaceae bacterium]|nr:hypothetical protein [Gemmatimonadaceae bacterium]